MMCAEFRSALLAEFSAKRKSRGKNKEKKKNWEKVMESNEFLFSPESQRRKKYFKLLFQNSKKGKKKKKPQANT